MWNSLRLRLATIFIGLAIGPLLLMGVILAQRSFTLEREQALDLQRQIVQYVSTEIEAFLQERESELRLLGGEIRDLDQSDRAQQIGLLLGVLRSGVHWNVYEELTLLDGQGQEQVRLSRQEIISTDELGDRSGAAEFEEPKASGKTYFGPVWFDETTGEALMTIAIPVFEMRSVRLKSVLVADIRFITVGDLIASLRVSEGQTIYVTDSEGRVVAHQNPSVELQDTRFEASEQGGAQTGLNGTDVVLAVDEIQLGEQGLSVVAERPASEALEPASNMAFTIAATIVVALVIASSLGFLVVRQIIRPIESLTSTARAISAGDLSLQVEVTGRDEIGQLAAAFNSMLAQLRDLFDSLEQRIAERKQAEEGQRQALAEALQATHALRESEKTTRALLNATGDSALLTDLDGIVLVCNEVLAKRLGVTVNELVGRCLFEFFDPGVTESRRAIFDECVRSGESFQHEDQHREIIFDNRLYPVLNLTTGHFS